MAAGSGSTGAGEPRPGIVMHSNTQLAFILEAVPALIGYVDADERYRFNNCFDAHLTKPVSPDQLAGVLATLARRRPSEGPSRADQ